MSRSWARWLTLLALMFSVAACSMRERGQIQGVDASPGALPPLAGTYAVNGFDPLGTEYGGTLSIEPGADPGHYRLQWIITGSFQEGIGEVQGNRLIVRWRTVEGLDISVQGVTTYTVTTEGELHGPRVVDGLPGSGRENAFPNSSD